MGVACVGLNCGNFEFMCWMRYVGSYVVRAYRNISSRECICGNEFIVTVFVAVPCNSKF